MKSLHSTSDGCKSKQKANNLCRSGVLVGLGEVVYNRKNIDWVWIDVLRHLMNRFCQRNIRMDVIVRGDDDDEEVPNHPQ